VPRYNWWGGTLGIEGTGGDWSPLALFLIVFTQWWPVGQNDGPATGTSSRRGDLSIPECYA
jgi:hypothetical protein